MDNADIENRFAYHPPRDEATKWDHGHVRAVCANTAQIFNNLLPEGREKSLAVTKIEEAMFWANAAIARSTLPTDRPNFERPLDLTPTDTP